MCPELSHPTDEEAGYPPLAEGYSQEHQVSALLAYLTGRRVCQRKPLDRMGGRFL